MKVLFVGDVHNHQYIFDDVRRLDKEYNLDRVIFLGDYVDDWNTTNVESIQTLNKVIELKKSNPDKYTFCIGNHELSYLQFPCSGHQYEREEEVNGLLENNINLFDLYTEFEIDENTTYVCSHAGFTNDYICQVLDTYGDWKPVIDKLQEDKLNNLVYYKYCSYMRGGNDLCSSPVWTDKRELFQSALREKMLIPNQIVGHSPVETITERKEEGFRLFFTDTHSTYRGGSKYGDKSYLLYDGSDFKKVF